MSIRSNWCEYDKETRKYIKKRDKNECVKCHSKGALQIMHVFLSRAKGGKGCKENGVLGCIKCHTILDNPIGQEQINKSKEIMDYCKKYLIEKENIEYNQDFINSLKFDKVGYEKEQLKKFEYKLKTRCKNCKWLVKNKYGNTSIPTYYCKIKRKIQNKNEEICEDFKNLQIN